ncbi:hypothetical protein AMATHDRAFT_70879 [Amanita thiersii Skay4041]|uniref:Uncharacterized protein n=1 Tax=Amanita thiersii Skay4041 TaxID=703135 RepID=A0A2A9NDX5_9AGAR|nr:hypothetical protein AMATHDRAFT_70879 [Amanita thiersii Skay4041]
MTKGKMITSTNLPKVHDFQFLHVLITEPESTLNPEDRNSRRQMENNIANLVDNMKLALTLCQV